MKARITVIFAAAIVALALAASAVAAPHQNGAKTWSHQAPTNGKTWNITGWSHQAGLKTWSDANNRPEWPIIGFFGLKGWSPADANAIKPWTTKQWTTKQWTVRGWSVGTVKPWAVKTWSVRGW
jgi:opacity protein-like surface antigen